MNRLDTASKANRLDTASKADRLDAAQIRLPGVDVRVVAVCDSTNTVLVKEKRLSSPVLLAAEEQTAGRGQRGRRWHSAPGRDISFSLARRIARPARELAALSLVAGVAAATALRALGVSQAALKWPNDLVVDGAKLGGILVETRVQGGTSLAVIGIGINFATKPGLQRRLRRRIADVAALVSPVPSRNEIIEKIALALLEALTAFEARGFEAAREDWLALHAHAGQRLRVRLADGRTLTGIAAGVADDGCLRLQTRSGLRAVRSGHVVSARAALAPRPGTA
jgi:BirA family transcriptional regulator, biotin operon repressor / biotin---[acetyl-CoA-carboxylase] ligase